MTTTKTTKKETEEPEEEEEYLTYTFNVAGDLHIEFHECTDIRIMSGQPTPPNWPPK